MLSDLSDDKYRPIYYMYLIMRDGGNGSDGDDGDVVDDDADDDDDYDESIHVTDSVGNYCYMYMWVYHSVLLMTIYHEIMIIVIIIRAIITLIKYFYF